MKFQEIQREVHSNDELCLFLKFHLRIASAGCLVLSAVQIYLTRQYNLEFHPFIDMLCLMTQIFQLILGMIGLVYSFSYIKKLQQSQCSYNEDQNDLISRGLFIGTCLIIAADINIGIINPLLFRIGMQSQVAQLEYTSFQDVQLFSQNMSHQSNILVEVILTGFQTVALLFMGYVYLLFCKNATTYNYFIYVMALSANFIALVIFSLQDNIKSLEKVNFIPHLNNQFLVNFISSASIFICFLILTLFLVDVLSTYYRIFKNPIYKFILGNILIGLSFALVGSNGQLIRNMQIYQSMYSSKQECRIYMNLVPESVLKDLGCLNKYFEISEEQFLNCPKDQQTQVWENKEKQQMACINWNCCGLISQVLLNSYISYCLLTNFENIFLIMLAIMLFQIRLVQDNAISQTIKQIAVLFSLSLIFVGIFTINTSPDIQVYRKTYVEPKDYLPINNVNTLPTHMQFETMDWLPQECSQKVATEIIQEINDYSRKIEIQNSIEIILSINKGYFLLKDVNSKDLLIYQFNETGEEMLYFKGDKTEILEIISNKISVCILSTQTSIKWTIQDKQVKKLHYKFLNNHNQLLEKPSQVQQQLLTKLISYINVTLLQFSKAISPKKGTIKLFNSLLYNCQDIYNNAFLILGEQANNDNENSLLQFYNYPKGQYGTIIYETENYQSCIYFQSYENIYIQPIEPIKSQITITLQWFGYSDLDLIVENQICRVGPKYQINCGSITSQLDSFIGNQQLNNTLEKGEQVTIDYLSSYNYLVYVQITMTKEEHTLLSNNITNIDLFLQSNAQVQLFSEGNRYPQASISVRQIVLGEQPDTDNLNKFKYKWVVGCIKNGTQFNSINKIQTEVEC